MAQTSLAHVLEHGEQFGMLCRAGDVAGVALSGVEMLAIDEVGRALPGHLVIVLPSGAEPPRAYQIDIVIRRAIAAEVAALLFVGDLALAETSRSLADRGALPVLTASAPPSDLAVSIDRLLRGGAAEALARAEHAVVAVRAVCAGEPLDARSAVLEAAGAALGAELRMVDDPSVTWTDSDAVCIGEVAVGRLVADEPEAAVQIALPVVAAMLSRALQRESQVRFGPARSRADLVVELLLAESSRIDALAVDAARAGLPVQFAHAAAWITPRHRDDPERRLPAALVAAIELTAFQLTDGRDETWHLAVFHDDLVVVASEESGAPDHQRRVRDLVERLVAHGSAIASEGWTFTVASAPRSPARRACGSRRRRRASPPGPPSPPAAWAPSRSPTSRACAGCSSTSTHPRSAARCSTTCSHRWTPWVPSARRSRCAPCWPTSATATPWPAPARCSCCTRTR
ncbi:hypothetical protein [Rathayibacter sp. VKM Ac-2630]|uniref:hypothetical protein n=1 Tax=Rathayibacter sp. VKM Ac-2630 TaxID=1938617 RepID=UPI00191BF12D|nr:hypothetical protein [Rathayibacter sp. VKM Ac-2630]